MQKSPFNPINTPLLKGVNLIEASAGTGKTYAIAMLVLRFIVEHGLAIDQLLVVTFTKAATEELKDRIRSRLVEAGYALNHRSNDIDPNINTWLAGLDIQPELIKQRLTLALLDIDRAGIFTIHGFCQRVLKEHALESGQLFDTELTGDLAVIKQAIADDFWRKQLYQRPAWEVAVLTAEFSTPDALLASIAAIPSINAKRSIYPTCDSLEETLKKLHLNTESVKAVVDHYADTVSSRFAEQTFKTTYTEPFDAYFSQLKAWIFGNTTQPPEAEAFDLFSLNGLTEALNGNKFKTTKAVSGAQRKADYLNELSIDTKPFEDWVATFKQVTLVFRKSLADTLYQELSKHLQRLNVISYDDLITRLAETLQSEKGQLLTAELQLRFQGALIDEFQDTDDQQWFIFSTVFASSSHYLYLIGDPKQAIYKFRGADIYSYLEAQQHAEHRFTLLQNWRSHPQLVEAVNVFNAHVIFLMVLRRRCRTRR